VSCPSTNVSTTSSYPRLFEGIWQCTTIVTASSVAAINVGTCISSVVSFFRSSDDTTCAHFYQPGWTEARASVTRLSKIEARGNRTNYFGRSGLQSTWVARSQDHFKQVNATSIYGESFIEQYTNYGLAGQYRTSSRLSRLMTPGNSFDQPHSDGK
jgi:hypothetical protein